MLYKVEFKPQSLKVGLVTGKKQFAVIPYEEFLKIQEELNDYEDFKELRQAKKAEKNAPTVSLEEAKKELGL